MIRKGSLILEISNSASDELLSRIGGFLGAGIMQPDSEDLYCCRIHGSTPWDRWTGITLLNLISSLIHMKRIFFFSSAAGAVTASKGLYGKVMDSFYFTKGWSLGGFSWPRTKEEALEITSEQYQAIDEGGWRSSSQTSDSGSASPGSPVKHCAKRRKSKIFSAFAVQGGSEVIPQLGLIAFIQLWSTYQQQAAVWISTLKTEKTSSFFGFSECLSYGENDETLFYEVRFFFCFAVQ